MKLNLGCGKKLLGADWINVDKYPNQGVNQIVDLDKYPWPWPSWTVSEIWMDNVLEHLQDPVRAIFEIHRILRQEGKAIIIVPYFRTDGAFMDITHAHYFGPHTLDHLQIDHKSNYYLPVSFSYVKGELSSLSEGLPKLRDKILPKIVRRLLNYFMWNMFDHVKYTLIK